MAEVRGKKSGSSAVAGKPARNTKPAEASAAPVAATKPARKPEPIEAAAPLPEALVEAPVSDTLNSEVAPAAADPAPVEAAADFTATALVAAAETETAAAVAPAEPAAALSPAPAPAALAELSDRPATTPAPKALMKGFFAMATAPETTTYVAAERFQSLFGDVNERTKTAVEKGTKFAEELTELTKGNVEALVASGRVAAKGAESLTQEAAEYSKKSFESATAALKSFAAVKSPTELFQLQSDFAKASFDNAVAEASKVSESVLKLAGEIVQPLSSRYAVAAEKLKAAAL